MTTITIHIDEAEVYEAKDTPERGRITRDQHSQAYHLFKVIFGTLDQEARRAYVRTLLGHDPVNWAYLNEDDAAQLIRALEATLAVDTLLGERYARIRGC